MFLSKDQDSQGLPNKQYQLWSSPDDRTNSEKQISDSHNNFENIEIGAKILLFQTSVRDICDLDGLGNSKANEVKILCPIYPLSHLE